MEVDDNAGKQVSELKIKGQAEVERRKSKWEEVDDEERHSAPRLGNLELEKRENELKEKALRNKVVRTRKGSNGPSGNA